MINQKLEIKPGFFEFDKLQKLASHATNLFIITHLGQLKQMQALICQQNLQDNLLVVLYTYKNIQVPSDVQEGIDESLFSQVIFTKIPHGLQKDNIQKNIRLNFVYKKILSLSKFKTLYINSFEGHYNIVLSLAKSAQLKLVLVEEGTATYKLKSGQFESFTPADQKITQAFLKQSFMETIGQSQIFKKAVKVKKTYQKNRNLSAAWQQADISYRDTKLLTQFGSQVGKFGKKVWNAPMVQKSAVNLYAKAFPVMANKPFVDFDKVYASYPELLVGDFGTSKIEPFFAYNQFGDDDLKIANEAIEQYKIGADDVLFISQRYALDLRLYMKELDNLFRALSASHRVLIKLHPKENDFILQMYQTMAMMSGGRIVVLDHCSKIPAEALLAVSSVKAVIGLTSSTLIYAPLMRRDIQVISIAKLLIERLAWYEECKNGIAVLQQHVEILERFDGIVFARNDEIGEKLC